jgi:hypothetical protein
MKLLVHKMILLKNQIIEQNSNYFENLKEKVARKRIHFLNQLFNKFKISRLRCESHV